MGKVQSQDVQEGRVGLTQRNRDGVRVGGLDPADLLCFPVGDLFRADYAPEEPGSRARGLGVRGALRRVLRTRRRAPPAVVEFPPPPQLERVALAITRDRE